MKVVINKCYGGFSLSVKAVLWLFEHGFDEDGFKTPIEKYWTVLDSRRFGYKDSLSEWRTYQREGGREPLTLSVFTPDEKSVLSNRSTHRSNPLLIKCIEELGEAANGRFAELKIIEIPDGIKWIVSEYDGMESIEEEHRSWS